MSTPVELTPTQIIGSPIDPSCPRWIELKAALGRARRKAESYSLDHRVDVSVKIVGRHSVSVEEAEKTLTVMLLLPTSTAVT